jgi:peptide deformylase
LRYGERGLHGTAAEVMVFDDSLQRLIDDMIETMYAAPRRRAGGHADRRAAARVRHRSLGRAARVRADGHDQSVLRDARGHQLEEEGCLSAPGFNATVVRPRHAAVKGLDRHGNEQTIEGEGLLARAFQHEMDHLDGVVFIDRLRGIKRT